MQEDIKKRRGWHKTQERLENKKRIEEWFKNNLYGTQLSCSKDLGLSKLTVNSIVKILRSEQE